MNRARKESERDGIEIGDEDGREKKVFVSSSLDQWATCGYIAWMASVIGGNNFQKHGRIALGL